MPTATHHTIIAQYDDQTQQSCFDTLLSTIAPFDMFNTAEVRQEETMGWIFPSGVKTFNGRRKATAVCNPLNDTDVSNAVNTFRTCIGSVPGDGKVNYWHETVTVQ